MAAIKSFTDLQQSKKLAEILPLESADMKYISFRHKDDTIEWIPQLGAPSKYDIYCWNLAALLDILPYPQLSKDKLGSGKVGWMVSVYPNDCRYDSCWHNNPIDACYEMILKLHDNKLL